jgi:hypothetical protein
MIVAPVGKSLNTENTEEHGEERMLYITLSFVILVPER